MLQLAIAWGQPLEYVEGLPFEVIAEFKALNAWVPFTPEREAGQLGVIASMLSQKIHKKPKSADQLFPYLKQGVPSYLEDERVAKARSIYNAISQAPKVAQEKQLPHFFREIEAEIELEREKADPDVYVIRELSRLINKG